MAIITLPAAFGFTTVDLRMVRASSTARSRYTGKAQRIIFPMAYWRLEGRLVEYDGPQAAALRAFLVKLEGVKNIFRLPVPGYTRPSGTYYGNSVASDAPAARSTVIKMGGVPANTLFLKAGDYFTVNDELKMVMADATSDASAFAFVTFQPPLRQAVALNTPIALVNPTCLMRAEDDDVANWDLKPPFRHAVTFTAIEEI